MISGVTRRMLFQLSGSPTSMKTGPIKTTAQLITTFINNYDSTRTVWLAERCVCMRICDPPQEFDAKGESTRTTRLHDTLSVP